MIKRFTSLLLIVTLVFTITTIQPLFTEVAYAQSNLTDIQTHWAKEQIEELIGLGAINGYPNGTFKPNATMTRAEFIKVLTATLGIEEKEKYYFSDTIGNWSSGYVCAAVDAGILNLTDYMTNDTFIFKPSQNITREEIATMLTRALGEEYSAFQNAGKVLNFIDQGSMNATSKGYIKVASDQGIITGYPDGSFGATKTATRAEASVMIMRMLNILDSKQSLTVLDGELIYENYIDSIVTIMTYEKDGYALAQGSGFVVKSTGQILTNYHVIEGADSIEISFADGTKKKVIDIYDYNVAKDVAILNIEGSTYKAVTFGNSNRISTGEKIYTLGSPLGLDFTISEGIISYKNRVLDGREFIQISAPISEGSSGGALINKYGQVIGINSASFYTGQNLNLSIPIDLVTPMIYGKNYHLTVADACSIKTLSDFAEMTTCKLFNYTDLLNLVDEDIDNRIIPIDAPQNIALEVELEHDTLLRNNYTDATIMIYGENEYFYQDTFDIVLTQGTNTHVIIPLDGVNLKTMGKGAYSYYIDISGMDYKLGTFAIGHDYKLEEFNLVNTNLITYNAEDDIENLQPQIQFYHEKEDSIGFKFRIDVLEALEVDEALIYKLILSKDKDGIYEESGNYMNAAIGNKGDTFYEVIDDLGYSEYYSPGHYKLEIQVDNQTIDTAEFDIIGMDYRELNITEKSFDIFDVSIYDEIKKDEPLLGNDYYIDYNFKVGPITKDYILYYKTVYKCDDKVIAEYEDYDYFSDYDSNSTITLWDRINFSEKDIENVKDKNEITFEVYFNNELFYTDVFYMNKK